jgi:exodeoxyribonuclease VII large subunit
MAQAPLRAPLDPAVPVLDFGRDIWTVSRLNAEVRAVLDGSFPLLWVQGELSNLAQPASGHIYFSLKDAGAQVRCAMFRPRRRLLAFRPGNGQQVLVRARVGLYEPRGEYQLIVEHMEPAGEGALRIELERRKQRLAAEGLFDEALKRPLPRFPRRIGLITSASGAALHDLLTVLARRLPLLPVLVFPVQVQGEGAAAMLLEALDLANRRADCDLLILARGGGSLEDLMPFNDEALARGIRASAIPVVTGIGHEVDLTIADLAADRRGATPSAAAELATPDVAHLRQRLAQLAAALTDAQRRRLLAQRQRLEASVRHLRLLHPGARLQQQAQRLDELERRLAAAAGGVLARRGDALAAAARRLHAASPRQRMIMLATRVDSLRARLLRAGPWLLASRRERLARLAAGLEGRSPLATLRRGYALVTTEPTGAVLRDAVMAPPGSRIRVRLQQGMLTATVDTIEPDRRGDATDPDRLE